MGKEAYYFSHDSNARNDERILELRDEFGWEGYGMFWAIVELLRDSSDYTLSKSVAMLKQCLNIDKELAESFLNKCIDLGLFVENDGRFYSESLMKRMEEIDLKRAKRAEAGRKGGNAKAMLQQSPSNALANRSKESKVKEKKEINIGGFKNSVFIPFLNSVFSRKETTRWSEKEIAALKKLSITDHDLQLIVKLYNSNYEYKRRDLLTLLNNWQGEIDRANNHFKKTATTTGQGFDFNLQ